MTNNIIEINSKDNYVKSITLTLSPAEYLVVKKALKNYEFENEIDDRIRQKIIKHIEENRQ